MSDSISTAEYSAVRDGAAGLIDLSYRGRILVSGSEAVMFLNGLITNDMKSLAVNAWMPAAFANVQGRLLAAVRVIHRPDGFLIDTESETRDAVIKLVERFTLAGDFKVTDLSTEMAVLSVQGTKAADVVRSVLGEDAAHLQRKSAATAQFESAAVTVIRDTHTAEDGFDLFVEANAAQQLREALTNTGVTVIGEDTLEMLRIEAGIPRYGIDMDENNVVTETNLDDAVSFTKGCYIGQEIIVRIKHRGHVAKKLAGVILDEATPAPRNSKIISNDEKEIGRVTSSTFSPRLKRAIALVFLKYDYLAPGTNVKVIAADFEAVGTVAELPFVRGSWYED
ncbi:MAG TPA: glycine cleavage T C-terminal barrel domain-containing protein [Pyrinomonadaceae bacterium]|jgi:folate-binding protein YgfZ